MRNRGFFMHNRGRYFVQQGSAPDVTAPSVPGNLAASSITATGLTLTWDASTDNVGVTQYEVQQRLASGVNGDYVTIGTVAAPTVTLAVTGLTGNTEYRFRVRARDAAGNQSAWGPSDDGLLTDTFVWVAPSVTATSGNPVIAGIARDDVGGFILVGNFATVTGVNGTFSRANICQVDATGNITSWNPSTATGRLQGALRIGSYIYVWGGATTIAGSANYGRLCRFDAATLAVDTTWQPRPGGQVSTLIDAGAYQVIAGEFQTLNPGGLGTINRGRAAWIDVTQTGSAIVLAGDPGLNSAAYAAAAFGDIVVVAGQYTSVNPDASGAVARLRLAAFDRTKSGASLLTAWDPRASGTIFSLTPSQTGSIVYVSGAATSYNPGGTGSQTRTNAAALDVTKTGADMVQAWDPRPDAADGSRYIRTWLASNVLGYVGQQTSLNPGGTGAQSRLRAVALDVTKTGADMVQAWDLGMTAGSATGNGQEGFLLPLYGNKFIFSYPMLAASLSTNVLTQAAGTNRAIAIVSYP